MVLAMASPEQLARVCKVLSVAARVRIVEMLKGRALCVGALSSRLDITQGAVSQHLRILRDAGVVAGEKRGCFVHYWLNEDTLADYQRLLDRFLRAGSRKSGPCKVGPPTERKRSCARRNPSAKSRRS